MIQNKSIDYLNKFFESNYNRYFIGNDSKLYTKKVNGKTIDRGVAFPVCVSVNDVVCNCSPLNDTDPESTVSCRLESQYSPRAYSLCLTSRMRTHDSPI